MAKHPNWLMALALLLLIVGGLNWVAFAFMNTNFVSNIFGSYANWVYGLVGASAVYAAIVWISGAWKRR